jgi:hypothetical protein
VLSALGYGAAGAASSQGEAFTAALLVGVGGCLVLVGLIAAGVRVGTAELRAALADRRDRVAAPARAGAGPLGPPSGFDDVDAMEARHGDAIADLLARGEDPATVEAELRRAFPSATEEERRALLRRVEDRHRRSSDAR